MSLGRYELLLSSGGNQSFYLSDKGQGIDSLVIKVSFALGDTGQGNDTVSSGTPIPLVDSGHGVDTLGIVVSLPLADSGHGIDTEDLTVVLTLGDSGQGVDAANVTTGNTKFLFDSGHGIDSVSIDVVLGLEDLGLGVDVLSMDWFLGDSGHGTDLVTVTIAVPLFEDIYWDGFYSNTFNIKNLSRSMGNVPNRGTFHNVPGNLCYVVIKNDSDDLPFTLTLQNGFISFGGLQVPLTLAPGTMGIYTATLPQLPLGPIGVFFRLNTAGSNHVTDTFTLVNV